MKQRRKYGKPEVVKLGNIAVKIYRRPKAHKVKDDAGKVIRTDTYTVYEVADFTGGTRRLRSFNDHGDAKKEAERIARQLSKGQVTAANMTAPQTASYGRAMELIAETGASIEHVASVYAKCYKLVGDRMIQACEFFDRHDAGKVTAKLVPEVVDLLLEVKRKDGASNDHIKDLKYRCGKFAKKFAVDISSITTADVQSFLDGLELSKQSKKNFRTTLNNLFEFAEARGYIIKDGNPVARTEEVKIGEGGAIQIFNMKEITALLKHSPREFVPVMVLGAFAGLRAGEIERLEWSNIDFDGGYIEVAADKAKTRSRRLAPLLPNLREWLKDYRNEQGLVWKGTETDLAETRSAVVKAAQTPWKDNALRHSYISYRVADIQDANKTALEAGNSPEMVFKHYRELVKPAQAREWFELTPEIVKEVK